jgi:AcrR family transcriptional regulator
MAERRTRILDAARDLIEAQGYESLTMRELARVGEVTVPTIYNLFGNKESVLLAAVEEQTKPFVAGLGAHRGDLIEVIEAAVRQLIKSRKTRSSPRRSRSRPAPSLSTFRSAVAVRSPCSWSAITSIRA